MSAIGLTALSTALGLGTKLGSTLLENTINSPKAQIRRLKEAGIHPNAFYEMGNTGGVKGVDLSAGDISAQFKNFTDGLVESEKHSTMMGIGDTQPVPITGQPLFDAVRSAQKNAGHGINLYREQALAGIENQRAGATKSLAEAKRSDALLPGDVRQQTADYNKTLTETEGIAQETKLVAEKLTGQIIENNTKKIQQDREAVGLSRDFVALSTEVIENRIAGITEQLKQETLDFTKKMNPKALEKISEEITLLQMQIKYQDDVNVIKDNERQKSEINTTFVKNRKSLEELEDQLFDTGSPLGVPVMFFNWFLQGMDQASDWVGLSASANAGALPKASPTPRAIGFK